MCEVSKGNHPEKSCGSSFGVPNKTHPYISKLYNIPKPEIDDPQVKDHDHGEFYPPVSSPSSAHGLALLQGAQVARVHPAQAVGGGVL